jgi:tRNA G18 (ribose-2'-O)-methylase SpoU
MQTGEAEKITLGMFIAEGDLVVERALAAGCRLVEVLTDAVSPSPIVHTLDSSIPVYAAHADVRKTLTGMGVALDIMGLFERPAPLKLNELLATAHHLLVVEDVDNPTNIGAIVRSAAAFGIDGVILDRNSADPLARRALRVSMGTAFSMRYSRVADASTTLIALRDAGYIVCGLTPRQDARNIREVGTSLPFDAKVAIVLGSERAGLSPEALSAVTYMVKIPMASGIDSLNVAAAAAVACHALIPQS